MPKSKQIRGLKQLLGNKQHYTESSFHGNQTELTYGGVNSSLLTSSQAFNTAGSTTGLIKTFSDKVRIKSIRLRGCFETASIAYALGTGNITPRVRQMVVWIYKPDQVIDASGTLPTLDQILEDETDVDSFEKTKTASGSSWAILHDEIYHIGVYGTSADIILMQGPVVHSYDIVIPVNRSQSYKVPPTSTNPGGHYDSDATAGQVTRGFPMLYTLLEGSEGGYSIPVYSTCNCRILYQE